MPLGEVPKRICYKDFYADWLEKEERPQEFPEEVLITVSKWIKDNAKTVFTVEDISIGYAQDESYIRVYYTLYGRWEDATLR
jgi:hypothetical protein